MKVLAILSGILFLANVLHGEEAPVSVAIVGDSTVADYPADKPLRGWGQLLPECFTAGAKLTNYAVGGRSTKTFRSEKRWEKVLAAKPQFILIQFGHNDSHAKDKPEATDSATDYPDYLRQYADEAKAIGATVIFITPMCRRTFTPAGELNDNLGPYAEAMKKVAAEKGIYCIDLHALSGAELLKRGEAGSTELFVSEKDRTHFGETGARLWAQLIAAELKQGVPELAKLLK